MKKKTIIAQAPGRINLIGEHTDYNDGFVLPAAINKKAVFQLSLNGTASRVDIMATNVQESFSFDLSSFHPLSTGWQNYIMGVVHELQKLGAKMTGFEGNFHGDVPIGSGLSSSAALECSFACALNELFDLGFDRWQLIRACQMAEHHFVGIQCGIMDQFASVMGKKNQAMLLDCRSLEFQYYPLDFENYDLLLLNTQVTHTLSDSQYNQRRASCEEGVAILKKIYPQITNLRDTTLSMLLSLTTQLPEQIFKRCHHVVTENQRVKEATVALQQKDFQRLGQLLYQSHISLQTNYEVSCPELDFLVQQTFDKDYILGSRMMGGGFGGCTINVIDKKWKSAYVENISAAYYQRFGIDLAAYEVSIEDGATIVS